jgi:hypothetical protein
MPEIRNYVVTQTREVEVSANSLSDAITIASAAFEHGQNTDYGVKFGGDLHELKGIWGNTRKPIKELSIQAERTS